MKIILKSRLIVVFLVTFIPFTVIAQDRLSIAEVKDGLHVITGPGANFGFEWESTSPKLSSLETNCYPFFSLKKKKNNT